VELDYGPDGAVYVLDWSDIGECHDYDGVHRTSGRIFKIFHGKNSPAPLQKDLSKMGDLELVGLLSSGNEWHSRMARLILQDRALELRLARNVHGILENLVEKGRTVRARLNGLWALEATKGTKERWLLQLLKDPEEHVRVWAIQLLADRGVISNTAKSALSALAETEKSALVLSYCASAARKLSPVDRLPLLQILAGKDVSDPNYSLLIWYAAQPALESLPDFGPSFVAQTRLPKIRTFVSRRITENLERNPELVQSLAKLLSENAEVQFRIQILEGMSSALKGFTQAKAPSNWKSAADLLEKENDPQIKKLARELSAVFGDGRALDELRLMVSNEKLDFPARKRALQTLVQKKAAGFFPTLTNLFRERDMGIEAVKAIGVLGQPDDLKVLVREYPNQKSESAKVEIVNALAARPVSARLLVDAVQSGLIKKQEVSAFQVRQLRTLNDPEIEKSLVKLWPEQKPLGDDKRRQMNHYSALLTSDRLAKTDLKNGRRVFDQSCAVCHKLYSVGGIIGPDLTGADRRNLNYLLDNMIDPAGIVAENYRVSVIELKDGRTINGVIAKKTERTIEVQTPTELLTLEKGQIDSVSESNQSMMPEGLLQALDEKQVADLISYLMTENQVSLE
jgi:putative heme-binding domain-containing protein